MDADFNATAHRIIVDIESRTGVTLAIRNVVSDRPRLSIKGDDSNAWVFVPSYETSEAEYGHALSIVERWVTKHGQ